MLNPEPGVGLGVTVTWPQIGPPGKDPIPPGHSPEGQCLACVPLFRESTKNFTFTDFEAKECVC